MNYPVYSWMNLRCRPCLASPPFNFTELHMALAISCNLPSQLFLFGAVKEKAVLLHHIACAGGSAQDTVVFHPSQGIQIQVEAVVAF